MTINPQALHDLFNGPVPCGPQLMSDENALDGRAWRGEGFALWTCGKCAVIVDSGLAPNFDERNHHTVKDRDWLVRVLDARKPTHSLSVDALKALLPPTMPTCRTCFGEGQVACECTTTSKPCRHCDGEGAVECDLGHEHECRECFGFGVVGGRCKACKGDEEVGCPDCFKQSLTTVRIGPATVNAALLAHVLGPFSGLALLSAPSAEEVVCVTGDGWRAAVMPMRTLDGHIATVDAGPTLSPLADDCRS